MVNQLYTIKSSNVLDRVIQFVREYDLSAYESAYTGGFLRVTEETSWTGKTYTMVCIRVDTSKASNGEIIIEVISGSNSAGIFGGERKNVKDFGKALQKFCSEQNVYLEFNGSMG